MTSKGGSMFDDEDELYSLSEGNSEPKNDYSSAMRSSDPGIQELKKEKLEVPKSSGSNDKSGALSPRSKLGIPKLKKKPSLLNFKGFSRGKKKKVIESPPESAQDYKETVLSMQQMAFKLLSLQESCNQKRKALFHTLVAYIKASEEERPTLLDLCMTKKEEISQNELVMANLEHSIAAVQSDNFSESYDASAAFERFLADEKIDFNLALSSSPPNVVHSLSDIPDSIVKDITQCGISTPDIVEHLNEILSVIKYTMKSNNVTEKQLQKWHETRVGEYVVPNYGRIIRPIEHFLTDSKTRQNLKKNYKIINAEGKGGFGRVFFAKNRKTGEQVAIKKQKLNSRSQRRQIATEASFLYFCKHQNIVGYENIFQVGDDIWIIMEYLDGGTIHKALQIKKFSEGCIAFITDQILLGLKYLHSNRIVHRDLKGDNIMLTEMGDVVIVDLGLCIDVDEFNPSIHGAGTTVFMAPEIILGTKNITPAADIWSLGITLIEMANGNPPFYDNPTLGMFKAVTDNFDTVDTLLSDPSKWSNEFKRFITSCLQFDPEKRPTAEQLLTHRWFAEQITEQSQDDIMDLVKYCWTSQAAPILF